MTARKYTRNGARGSRLPTPSQTSIPENALRVRPQLSLTGGETSVMPASPEFFADFDLSSFKLQPCRRTDRPHDTTLCPFYHHQHDCRRDPEKYQYIADPCEDHFLDDPLGGAPAGKPCPRGDRCGRCHTVVELLYHPSVYKRRFCLHSGESRCPRSSYCAFAHSREEIADLAGMFTAEEEAAPDNNFFIYRFKTQWCPLSGPHDWNTCLYAHTKKDLRRTPLAGYAPRMCSHWMNAMRADSGARQNYEDCCPDGVECRMAHGLKEILYHPLQYKTRQCTDSSCTDERRRCCAFAHSGDEVRRRQRTQPPAGGRAAIRQVILGEQPYFARPLVFAAARQRQDEGRKQLCQPQLSGCAVRTPSPEPFGKYDLIDSGASQCWPPGVDGFFASIPTCMECTTMIEESSSTFVPSETGSCSEPTDWPPSSPDLPSVSPAMPPSPEVPMVSPLLPGSPTRRSVSASFGIGLFNSGPVDAAGGRTPSTRNRADSWADMEDSWADVDALINSQEREGVKLSLQEILSTHWTEPANSRKTRPRAAKQQGTQESGGSSSMETRTPSSSDSLASDDSDQRTLSLPFSQFAPPARRSRRSRHRQAKQAFAQEMSLPAALRTKEFKALQSAPALMQ